MRKSLMKNKMKNVRTRKRAQEIQTTLMWYNAEHSPLGSLYEYDGVQQFKYLLFFVMKVGHVIREKLLRRELVQALEVEALVAVAGS